MGISDEEKRIDARNNEYIKNLGKRAINFVVKIMFVVAGVLLLAFWLVYKELEVTDLVPLFIKDFVGFFIQGCATILGLSTYFNTMADSHGHIKNYFGEDE